MASDRGKLCDATEESSWTKDVPVYGVGPRGSGEDVVVAVAMVVGGGEDNGDMGWRQL